MLFHLTEVKNAAVAGLHICKADIWDLGKCLEKFL